ncbi:ABC transporter permease [Brachybacterium sp. DNPG3]
MTASAVGSWRIPELVLFACLIFEDALFGLPLPFNQVAMALIIVLGMTRSPCVALGRLQLIVPVLAIGLFYIAMISMFADPSELASDWSRRFIRLALTGVFILVVAAGRIDLRSALAGTAIGLYANAIAFYAGVAPDGYGGVLSGFLIDKNVAGMTYAIFGILVLLAAERPSVKAAIVLSMGGLVWLTGSRTSISAFVAAVLWIIFAPRIGAVGRWVMGVLIVVTVDLLAEDFSRIGIFSDREGSDLLRSRINAATQIKVSETGFFGQGLGEAYIVFEDNPTKIWYFHNSFSSALVEGGWPWLLLLLGITIVVALRPFGENLDKREVIVQAATITTLICAWKLGEVLFTLQWGLLIGVALLVHAEAKAAAAESDSGTVEERRG